MCPAENPYQALDDNTIVARAAAGDRADFITKTYLHLAGAIGLLVVLEVALCNIPGIENLVGLMIGGRWSWLIVLGLFMGVSWMAESWARSDTSIGMQYLGLGLYVVAEAIILLPMIYIASNIDPNIITTAVFATLGLLALLTAVVFVTRADFSFMRGILMFGGVAAMGLIGCAIVFQFALGPIFTYAMIAFACAYILYHTSAILHQYRVGQHVAASLALFSSVALLFWYILQLFMSRD